MLQQSLTRSLLRKVDFRKRKRSPHRPRGLMLAALILSGLLTPRAFSQYSQPPQTIYGGGYSLGNAANNNHDAIQLANQSDQQLFSEARLFEQQGRSAQAQRIYFELQRRSLIRSQSSQATFNHIPPRGYSSYGSTASSYGPTVSSEHSRHHPGPRPRGPRTEVQVGVKPCLRHSRLRIPRVNPQRNSSFRDNRPRRVRRERRQTPTSTARISHWNPWRSRLRKQPGTTWRRTRAPCNRARQL